MGRSGVILGSLRDHFGTVLASFWGRFGVVLTPFEAYLGSFFGPLLDIYGPFLDHFWAIVTAILRFFWYCFGKLSAKLSQTMQKKEKICKRLPKFTKMVQNCAKKPLFTYKTLVLLKY